MQPPPISLKHEASQAIYMTACNPNNGLTHSEVRTLAEAVALLEKARGNVPTFVDAEAEAFLRAKADEVEVPGRFKAVVKDMKYESLDLPKGVLLLGGLFTIDGANSARAARQLRSMADKCTGSDAQTNLNVLETRIEGAIRRERKAETQVPA